MTVRALLLAILCMTTPAVGYARHHPASSFTTRSVGNSENPDASKVDRWREEGRRIVQILEQVHPNPWFRCPRSRFLAAVADLEKNLPHLDEYRVILRWRVLLASLGDEHTLLFEDISESRSWPLLVRILPQGVFVRYTDEAHRDWLGARITAVGNEPVEDFLESLNPFVSAAVPSYRQVKLGMMFRFGWEWLTALRQVSDGTPAQLSLVLKNGRKIKSTIESVDSGSVQWISLSGKGPLLRDVDPERSYAFRLLDRSRTLYLRYRACRNDDSESVETFAERLEKGCQGLPLARVIVDLRGNGGGNSALFDPLNRWIEKQKVFARPGSVLVLTDARTFSSAFLNAWSLQERGAKVLGAEPGQPINAYGDVRATALPGLHATLGCSTKSFILLPNENMAWHQSLKPDAALDESINDSLGLTDSVLDRVLATPPPYGKSK